MPNLSNAHALVVGIANYNHISKLPPTVLKDARDVCDLLIDPNVCAYPRENVQLLLDDEATQAGFREQLGALAARSDADSTVLIYLSSHGTRIESGPCQGEYLLPVDTRLTSARALAESAISGNEFTSALGAIPASKLIVFFDCCHSGGIGQPKDPEMPQFGMLPDSYYEMLKSGRGRVIFASSRSTEYSWVLPNAQNSLFTQHLLAGLRGGAPGPGGVIRVFDLFAYVQPRVTADQPKQHPIFKAEIEENFPVALYLGGKAPAPIQVAVPKDSFEWDVFISYRQKEPDKTWVRKTLLPQLQGEGLRVCIDYRDFRLGAPIVKEIERAVTHSRYTLCVLTPAYLESNFTDLETVLAQHLGLELTQRRMLAIMREECQPRLGIRTRLWLDMTQDDEFETNLARLAYEIRQPPNPR